MSDRLRAITRHITAPDGTPVFTEAAENRMKAFANGLFILTLSETPSGDDIHLSASPGSAPDGRWPVKELDAGTWLKDGKRIDGIDWWSAFNTESRVIMLGATIPCSSLDAVKFGEVLTVYLDRLTEAALQLAGHTGLPDVGGAAIAPNLAWLAA